MSSLPNVSFYMSGSHRTIQKSEANQSQPEGESQRANRRPLLPTDSLSASGLSVYAQRGLCAPSRATGSSARQATADLEPLPMQTRLHTNRSTNFRNDSGCHGCHTPVTPRGVTPIRLSQSLYPRYTGGVTGVTGESQTIARTGMRAPMRTRLMVSKSPVTPVTPLTQTPKTCSSSLLLQSGASHPLSHPPVTPVTPRGWSQ